MPNFKETSTNTYALTDEAVLDFATLIAYFRLTHDISRKRHEQIAASMKDKRSEKQAEYHERFDAMLAELGGNLRMRFDLFKLSIARQFVESQFKPLGNKRAKQLTGSPGELLRVAEITQGSQSPAIHSGHGGETVTEPAEQVDRGHNGETGSEDVRTGQRVKRKR